VVDDSEAAPADVEDMEADEKEILDVLDVVQRRHNSNKCES